LETKALRGVGEVIDGYAVRISIANTGSEDLQFDQVKTYYYAEGDNWGATLHEMEKPDTVAVYYIYKNSPQPPLARQWSCLPPSSDRISERRANKKSR
jgi:hypothetical protein